MKLSGFHKLSMKQRLEEIKKLAKLTDEEAETLSRSCALRMETADKMIENAVGTVHLPLAIATNFKINGREILVPMALEEPSVVAAASKAAKLCLPEGFTATAEDSIMMGQVQLVRLHDAGKAVEELQKNKDRIIAKAMAAYKGNPAHWGGIRDFQVELSKTRRGDMLSCNFFIDVKDVMGANTINTIMEEIAPELEKLGNGKARLRILSNLATRRKARATAVWKKDVLGADAIEAFLDCYEFAVANIYRCATHNKGIMNGIDAVALACGQDWRAVEAGAHAYAAIGGYHPLTYYEKTEDGDLRGEIELPLAAGLYGGAVNTNPTAKIALKILGAKTAKDLAMTMAAAGLANNFAALYALATTGIQAGHMKLHAKNIAMQAGATTEREIEEVAAAIHEAKNFSVDFAAKILEKIRKTKK